MSRFAEALKEWERAYRHTNEIRAALSVLDETRQELLDLLRVNIKREYEANETVNVLLDAATDEDEWKENEAAVALAVGRSHATVVPEDIIRIDILGDIRTVKEEHEDAEQSEVV